jgi:hypothetical protein
MALSKKALMRAVNSVPDGDDVGVWVVGVCRAVESEVRKQDEALIRQLVGALEDFDDAGPLGEGWKSDRLLSLLASARARLECKP